MLKAIAYAKVKTDPVDAMMLARLLRNGLIPPAWKTEKRHRELRELTRARLKWIYKRIGIQNQLSSLAGRYNLQITPENWKDLAELQKSLCRKLPREAYLEAQLSIDHIAAIQESILEVESAIDGQAWYHQDLKRLMQVPGIGRVSAWTILAEIGDISRFPTDKQFVSYCRLVPGSQDSGGKQRHKSGCKDGNKYLKMAFTQAAIAGYCNHKPVRKYYQKLKRRRSAPVARNVVAKQLARIVWHMLAKDEPYKGFKGEPTKPTHISYWPHSVSPARPQGD